MFSLQLHIQFTECLVTLNQKFEIWGSHWCCCGCKSLGMWCCVPGCL